MTILAMDCETTGVDAEADLLTVYFGVYDNKFNFIDELDLKVRPDSGVYRVEPRALEVNKIDLPQHHKESITYREAKPLLYNFLSLNYHRSGEMLIPLGHGVNFDVDKITRTLISRQTWEQFVSYRKLCTATIAQFLQVAGFLPKNLNAGLSSLADFCQIPWEGEAHTAKSDTIMAVNVFQSLKNLVKPLV